MSEHYYCIKPFQKWQAEMHQMMTQYTAHTQDGMNPHFATTATSNYARQRISDAMLSVADLAFALIVVAIVLSVV
jgi:hypothetical protein